MFSRDEGEVAGKRGEFRVNLEATISYTPDHYQARSPSRLGFVDVGTLHESVRDILLAAAPGDGLGALLAFSFYVRP